VFHKMQEQDGLIHSVLCWQESDFVSETEKEALTVAAARAIKEAHCSVRAK
jgi:hypothetical protein